MTNGNMLIEILKGGRGSGDWGHVGRAGKRGGSGGGGGKGRPRKGRRSREALDKEIAEQSKPKVDVAAFDKKVANARKTLFFGEPGGAKAWDDNEVHSEYKNWSSKISGDQKQVLEDYTSAELYKEINNHLRGIESNVSNNKEIKDLDDTLDSAPRLSKDTMLYRATDGDILKNLKPGDEFIDRGFGSTTIAEDFADGFVTGDIKLRILAPKGSKGAYIADHSPDWFGEGEFLLPRNAKFRVMKATKGDPNEVREWNIWLEYIGAE